ncbi:GRASP55/65 PDZ-like domain-containing protein [Gongronella butleri]|nr:GRASP55/65 PDZ-like domain-containing protein [Gongronella butleri]
MGGTHSTEHGRSGFHVLKVKENSPAFHAGIEQFFDYLVAVNGASLQNGDSELLVSVLRDNIDKDVTLTLYSSKQHNFRDVTLVPSASWSNHAEESSLIGCSIRYCSYEHAGDHVWHILNVSANSPAEMAGIIPHTDYVIGSPLTVLRGEDDFYNLVEDNIGKPLQLYVYNTEWDSSREVIIVPNREWGGNGCLGCDVGYGLLHRIPRKVAALDDEHEQQREQRDRRDSAATYSQTIFNAEDFTPSLAVDNSAEASIPHGVEAVSEAVSDQAPDAPSPPPAAEIDENRVQ